MISRDNRASVNESGVGSGSSSEVNHLAEKSFLAEQWKSLVLITSFIILKESCEDGTNYLSLEVLVGSHTGGA
jgi:hypothetical protein